LVECHAMCSNSKGCPDSCKQPQAEIFQGVDDLTEVEVLLVRAGRVRWESGLDEFLLPLC
jgi:hypothetical protein